MTLPRLSTRRVMTLVALVALLLGGWSWLARRVGHFLELSSHHTLEGVRLSNPYLYPRSKARSEWHLALGVKYREAAQNPFRPVAPDPPEPGDQPE